MLCLSPTCQLMKLISKRHPYSKINRPAAESNPEPNGSKVRDANLRITGGSFYIRYINIFNFIILSNY